MKKRGKHWVYIIPCIECDCEYTGQSVRSVKIRIKEHVNAGSIIMNLTQISQIIY